RLERRTRIGERALAVESESVFGTGTGTSNLDRPPPTCGGVHEQQPPGKVELDATRPRGPHPELHQASRTSSATGKSASRSATGTPSFHGRSTVVSRQPPSR